MIHNSVMSKEACRLEVSQDCHPGFHGDTSPSVSHVLMVMTCLWSCVLQHMLSPQRAPERLLQLADSNLGSLVTEMDELLSRVSLTHINLIHYCNDSFTNRKTI